MEVSITIRYQEIFGNEPHEKRTPGGVLCEAKGDLGYGYGSGHRWFGRRGQNDSPHI
jgi:hypothetical protein